MSRHALPPRRRVRRPLPARARLAAATPLALACTLAACSDGPSEPTPPDGPITIQRDEAAAPSMSAAGGSGGVVIAAAQPNARPIPNEYIVVLKDVVATADVGALATQLAAAHGARPRYTYTDAIKGFAARLTPAAAAAVARDPSVSFVEQDQEVRTAQDFSAEATQTGATWGLDRVDQRPLPLNGRFVYNRTGSNVHAYIIDTGIQTSHPDFGGRAAVAYDAIGGNGQDCNGHGTHVAGTVGGARYGVAKAVRLRAVRVLNCAGSGTYSGVIAGIDWVRRNRVNPAVANMSLGGGYSAAVNSATTALVNSGVFVAVAAGNSNANACNFSPASAARVATVAASDRTDSRARTFSNWGSCVELYAPGVAVASDWIGGGANTISGTSMASPHVAGAAALYRSATPSAAPSAVLSWLLNTATVNVIRSNVSGTPNRLLFKSTL